jgi:hypothetical protein
VNPQILLMLSAQRGSISSMQSAVVGRALASFLSMEILNLGSGDLVTIFDVSVVVFTGNVTTGHIFCRSFIERIATSREDLHTCRETQIRWHQ